MFDMLRTHFEQLRSIFDYYAKSGTAGSSSAGALLTMQQSELQTLAIDVGLTTDKFSMTRVINIFKRADQVDDTFKESAADARVIEGSRRAPRRCEARAGGVGEVPRKAPPRLETAGRTRFLIDLRDFISEVVRPASE